MRPSDEWAARQLARENFLRDIERREYIRRRDRALRFRKRVPILGHLWCWFGGYSE